MKETTKEIYEIFKSEHLTITIPKDIKCPVICHMRKYIEALELEYEAKGGDEEVFEDISCSKDLLLRLVLARDYEMIEMTIAEFIIFAGMIYCAISLVKIGFYEFDSGIVKEYKELYKSVDELYRMLDKKDIDEYKKIVKFKVSSITKFQLKV